MKKMILVILSVVSFMVLAGAPQITNPKIKAGFEATNSWLQLIDKKEFEKSWDATAKVFRDNVKKETWGPMIEKVNKTIGISGIIKRELLSADISKDQSKDVVNIKFKSLGSNQKEFQETIHLYNEEDKWKVSGYWIK